MRKGLTRTFISLFLFLAVPLSAMASIPSNPIFKDPRKKIETILLSDGSSKVTTVFNETQNPISSVVEKKSKAGILVSMSRQFRDGTMLIESFSPQGLVTSRKRINKEGSLIENFSKTGRLLSRQRIHSNGQSTVETY